MKRKKTPGSSRPLFESLESRLLLDATLIQPDGPMPQSVESDPEPVVEVSAETAVSEEGPITPSDVMPRPTSATQSVWDDTDIVHV